MSSMVSFQGVPFAAHYSATKAYVQSLGEALYHELKPKGVDVRHYIKQGPVLIDLTELPSDTMIVPRETGRALYYIKSQDSLRLYSDFTDFVSDALDSLDGATTARSMHARGQYDVDSNTFTAHKIGVYLIEP